MDVECELESLLMDPTDEAGGIGKVERIPGVARPAEGVAGRIFSYFPTTVCRK